MIIQNKEFGRIEVTTVPLPEGLGPDVNGTYTYSGRVLVSVQRLEKGKDWYRVFSVNDDGTDICEVYDGLIPKKQGANGIRWMCFADNKRVLLGDYVLECSPDLDHCERSELLEVIFPEEVAKIPGIFMRWSEPIIAPDMEHVCFSSLTGSGAFNFLGKLVRHENAYAIEDARIISSIGAVEPDPEHPGFSLAKEQRGGEVKQFVRGGRGITLAGGGRSISESCLQMLDSEETAFITDTLGYEETAIFSPDETCAVCMSPRFSPKTDFGVLGVVPLSNDLITRGRYLNVLYQYAIAGVRHHRAGNIGPALIHIDRSMKEGRAYQGVDLSDPEGRWVYYSPMSWHPDSTRALWNEKTRLCEGNVECRLRVCRLLDKAPAEPVPAQRTPDAAQIPYSLPASEALKPVTMEFPLRIRGSSGMVENTLLESGQLQTRYENFSEDGKTFYDGWIRVKAPANMFMPGETTIESDLQVHGEHNGQMKLRLTLRSDAQFQIYLNMDPAEDGQPKCMGFAEYDGLRRDVADMSIE